MDEPFLQMMSADDPAPQLHALRASDPVHFVESLGFWLVTRHDLVKSLFNDAENVSHDKRAWEFFAPAPEGSMRRWIEDECIFSVGVEEHDRLRRLVAVAFTPRAIKRMEDQITQVVSDIAAALRNRHGEVVDLRGEFTNRVPNAVISRITGVPPGADEEHFCAIAQAVVKGFVPLLPDDVQQEAENGIREFTGWIRSMVERRRAQPEDDFVSDLLRAQDADDRLCEDDIVLLLTSLIGAGSEATAQVATGIVKTLLEHPEAMQCLNRERERIPAALDELLRYTLNLPAGSMRYALRDFELEGRQIRKGQMLMLSKGGVNRDPAVYENPDVLDLDRKVSSLLTFGYGAHFCVGAHLARSELVAIINAFLDLVPQGSAVVPEEITYQDMGIVRQATSLPVRFALSPAA